MPKKNLQPMLFIFLVWLMLCSLVAVPELTVQAQTTFNPIINKSFLPDLINPGALSRLTIIIANPNTNPLTGAAFIDNMELNTAGLKLADPVNLVYSCMGVVGVPAGNVTAIPGGTTIQLVGGEVPGKVGSLDGQCEISVDVTSTYQGTIINTIPVGGLTAVVDTGINTVTVSNVEEANASIRMRTMSVPTVTKKFAKNTIYVGEVTTLTIDIKNVDGAIALTEVSLTDTLPGTVVLAEPVSPIMTGCNASSSPTLTAVSGTNIVRISNASIALAGTCKIVVNVSSPSQGIETNTIDIGAVQSRQGVTNTSPASDPINIQAIRINKAFSPATIQAGEISTLTIDLYNPTSTKYTGVSLADILPGTVLEVVDGSATTSCVGNVSTTLPRTVAIANGEVPAGTVTSPGSCWIKVNVTTPDAALNATYTNRIPAGALVTDQLITNALDTTAPITVRALSIGVSKTFSPTRIQQGSTSLVRITLSNPTLTPFTGVNFTDTLPTGLIAVLPADTATTCAGGVVDVTTDPTLISFTGGAVAARVGTVAGSCSITVRVTTTGSSFPITYTNTITHDTILTNEGITNLTDSSGNVDVYPTDAGITFTKTFNPTSILAGANSQLRIVVNAPQDEDLTNFSLTDNLLNGLTISNSTAASSSGCGAGAGLLANTNETQIVLSNATIVKNTACIITVYVTHGVSGSYPNTISPDDFVNDQGQKPPSAKTATLTVSNLTISKAFYPTKVGPGGRSTLTVTLNNTNITPLTSVTLTDDLTTMGGTEVTLASPVNATSNCGFPSFSYPDSQTFTMTGATVPPQVLAIPGVCTVSFDVVATGAAQTLTNTLARSNVSGTILPSGSVINPVTNATAQLIVTPLSLGVVKRFEPVTVFGGSSSTLSLKIINQNTTVLTGVELIDTMPAGMLVATPAELSTGACGGTLVAASGGQSIVFSGGRLEPLQVCTLTLKVTMNVIGNRTNTIQVGEVTSFNGASNDQAAAASLSNLPGASVAKYFSQDSIVVGNYTLLTIRITNTSNVALSGMGLIDTLPGTAPSGTLVIAGAPAPAAMTTCDYADGSGVPATLTAIPGEQIIKLANGKILAGPNTTCDIVVPVTSTTAGTYTNVIAKNSLETDEQATNTQPAEATLTVTAAPSLKVVKTIAGSGPFGDGNTINFRITATNNGNVPLTNVIVADTGVGAILGACAPLNGSGLAVGAEMICDASYVVQTADVTAGIYNNTATADSTETPLVSDTVIVPISPSALSITKSIITPAPYILGQLLTYEIRAKNIGSTDLTNVTITDASAALGICSPLNGSGLAVGAEMVCPATHVISSTDVVAQSYTNTATADSTETIPLTDTVTVQITQNPAMEIYKTVTSDGPYSVGSLVTFDISVINTGDVTLHNVQIAEVTGDTTLGTCPPLTLAPTSVISCTATHTVTAADMLSGGYSNTASADSDETGPISDTEIVITKSPKIELTKTGVLDMTLFGSAIVANPGDTITYTFTVKNSGEVTLTNLKLYELVSGVTITSGEPIPDLAAGESAVLTGLYTLTQNDINSNTFTNTAIATGDPPIGNPVSAPAVDTKSNLAVPSLNLVKTLTSGGNYNQAGAVIFYTYTLTNTGNVDLTGNGVGGLFTITDDYLGEFTCGAVTSLAIGDSITCTNNYTVKQADLDNGNSIINIANGHGKFGAQDVVSNEATATATETLTWNATLAKTLETTEVNGAGNDHTQAVIGEILTYKLVTSFPAGTTVSAKVVDTLDTGLAFVAVDSVTVSNPDTDGEFGNADVGLNSSKMTFDTGTSLCSNCIAGTNALSSNPFVENSGGKLTFDFGKIINTTAADETVTIIYRVMVLNISTNQSATAPLNNSAVFSWTGGSVTRSAAAVSVVEPNVNVTKSVDITTGVDAGNLLTYTVTITNPAVLTAFDTTLSDAFPYNATTNASQLENITITNVTDTDLVAPVTAANFTITCDDAPGCIAPNRWTLNTVTPFDMPQSRTITLTITANVSSTTLPNATIDNYAQVRWTSMDGDFSDRSTFVVGTSDSERTGADGPGGLLNDYARQNPTVARTTLTNLAGTKYFIVSSEAGTSDAASTPRVTIGEVVRYRIALRLNEGTMPDLSMLDNLPTGMRFINDAQARVAFVSDGAGMTSTTINNSLAGCDSLNVTGTAADLVSLPSASITCPLPDTAVAGGTVGPLNSRTSNVDMYNSGTDVYFKFGNILNSDNDASQEFIVVEFNAVVENLASNQGQNNLTGVVATTIRGNTFQAFINTASAPAPAALFTSNTINVQIAEPAITNLVKSVNPATGDAGDQVEYTVTFSNVSSVNASPAYDVVLTDNVPAKMTVLPINPATDITFTPAAPACGVFSSDTSSGNTITLTFTSLNSSCTVSVKYRATLLTSVIPGEMLTNSAVVNYSSLPLTTGTTPNPTGSNTPDDTGTATGERNGTGGQGPDTGIGSILNNYRDLASTDVTITPVQPVKSLASSTDLLTLGSNLTVGEVARYRMLLTLAEGTSPVLQLRDNIPEGLQYLDDSNTRLAFVSDNGIPTCVGSTASITSSDLTIAANPWVCGNETTIAAITPSFVLPNAAITGDPFIDPTFNLSDVINSDADANTEYVVLEFNARVLNVDANQDSRATTIDNNFTVLINAIDKGTSANVPVTVVEPIITLDKQLSFITGIADAGGVATYSVTVTNIGTAPAYETNFTDTQPAVLDFNLASVSFAFTGGASGSTDNSSDVLNRVNVTIGTIPVGGSATITYTANILATVTPNQLIQNTGNVTWTSLTGTDANERDGSGGINNYSTSDFTSFNSQTLVPVKSIVSTTAAHTAETGNGSVGSERDLTIGEVIRYRLAVTIPEGTVSQLQLLDTLPAGFTFLNDGDIRISFLANTDMTEEADLAGADNDALPPTFLLPAGRVSVVGQDITFTVADLVTANNLVNNDNDADDEFVVIDFNVRVNDDANNNNTDPDSNDFDLVVGGTTVATSNVVGTRIVEPLLNITKSVDDNTWAYGQTLLYTLNLTHTAASLTDAQDVVIADRIPDGLTYAGSITAPVGWVADDTNAPDLTWTCAGPCSMLTTDGTLEFTYQVLVVDPPVPPALPGGSTATNTASVTWSSLSGTDANERIYTDSASVTGTLADYRFSLGNRIWFDTNNNGLLDNDGAGGNPDEAGAGSVKVDLYKDDGTGNFVYQTTRNTNANGYYLFDYLVDGDYVVVIPSSNFAGGAVLDGYYSSGIVINSGGGLDEFGTPLSNSNFDLDDNGSFQISGGFIDGVAASPVTLGGTEPMGEPDPLGAQPDERANMTVDFGFYRTVIGDQVWLDENINGKYDNGEALVNGADVRLYVSDGTTDVEVRNTTTDINGVYSFADLPEGNYIVKVVGPAGTLSTIDTFNLADTTTPSNINDNDNGIGKVGNSVSSGTITMDAGFAQYAVDQSNGTTTNSTLDFGFVYPYAFGNRVWFDTDNDARIGLLEKGVPNVTLELYSTADLLTVVDTAITSADGYYMFDTVFPGEYVVVIPSDNFTTGKLIGYWSSDTKRGADGVVGELAAPDPDDVADDSDDNGTLQASGDVISSPIIIGPFGLVEPVDEHDLEPIVGHGTQPDGRSNLTVDFGFYRVELGDQVFSDGNQNGNYEPLNDVAIQGATVQLFVTDGITETEIKVGPDGILRTSDDAGSYVTDVNGLYLFSGLPQGDYFVKVTPLTGISSTIDSYNTDGDNLDPNVNADDNDNGKGTSPGIVSSGMVTLTPGSTGAPGYNNTSVNYDTGTTSNPTLDFGFIPAFSLGNRVWYDTNNSSQISGTEIGIGNVELELYNADALGVITTSTGLTAVTSLGGYYLFDNLPAGNYVVVIPASNFISGGALDGYWSSGINRASDGSISSELSTALSNTDIDSDDNGTLQTSGIFTGAVISSFVSLGPNINTEPPNEPDQGPGGQGQPDRQANMTVDFGFYTIELGDQVWNDSDKSGLLDGGEAGIFDVTVELWPADGSGAAPLKTTSTDINGNYRFTGLSRGDYLVRIPRAEFEGAGTLRDYVSSTGGDDPDLNFTDHDDNGLEIDGVLGLGGYIQSTVVSLTPAGEQSTDDAFGLTNETRVDFGVFKSPNIDLAITKTDKTPYYLLGGTLNYEIIVTNNGPADVVGAVVTDVLPAQISAWTWDCAVGTPVLYNCTRVASNSLDFTDFLDLPSGASVTYDVTADVDVAAIGDLTNVVTVNLPVGSLITESNLVNNSAQDIDTQASLVVTKDDGLTVVGPGTSLTYVITVQNTGDVDLTNITLTDTLSADLTYNNASLAPTTFVGNTLTWSGLSLTAGSSMTINVEAVVSNSPSSIAVTNNVDAADTNTGATATATDVDSVVFNSNFTKTLLGTNESFTQNSDVAIGEIVTYEITANLEAGLAFDNVIITDRMDKGLAFVDCVSVTLAGTDITNTVCPPTVTDIVDAGDAGNPANPGRQVQFNVGNINANEVASTLVIRYRAVVLDVIENQERDVLNNGASWTWLGGLVSVSANDVVIVEPDLTIDKSALPTSATAGTAIEFTLAIAHTDQSSADAFDVVVTDILPAGLEYIACTPISYEGLAPTTQPDPCLITGGELSFVWESFPLDETATIKFFARYTGSQSTLTNNASVAWSSLPLDPAGTPPVPVQLSTFNTSSTERWYDPLDPVNIYQVVSSVSINFVPAEGRSKTKFPKVLPATGFAPNVITTLPYQPVDKLYSAQSVWMNIAGTNVAYIPIVGVPLVNDNWDVTWLWQQAGWLNGTAFPGWQGNSVLTGHITLPNGMPGPFDGLGKLKWGDKIIVHAYGSVYTYEVRENRTIAPDNTSVLQHEEEAWLTLLTCKTYNESTNSYSDRIAVRAVLLKVENEKQPSILDDNR